MTKSLRHVPWSMVGVTAGLAIIDHGFRPLAGYVALRVGASATQVGLLATAFALGALVLAVPAGRIVDRFGPGKVLVVTSTVAPLPVVGALFVWNAASLLGVAILFGCVQILLVVAAQASVVGGHSAPRLDVIFGWLSAGTSVGQVVGPLLALALPQMLPDSTTAGLQILVALSCVVACGAFVSGMRLRRRTVAPAAVRRPTPVMGILRIPGIRPAVALSGVTLACLDLLVVFLPLWAQERGVGAEAVAALLGVRGAMSLVSRMGMHLLVARFTRKFLVTASLFVGAVSMGALPFVGSLPAYAMMAAIGFCLGLVQPLTMTWVVSIVLARDRGAALGLRMLANRLMQVAMPLVVSGVAFPLSAIASAATRSLTVSAVSLLVGAVVGMRAAWDRPDPDETP